MTVADGRVTGGQFVAGGGDRRRVGDVDGDRVETGVLGGDLPQQGGAPATDDDGVALGLQAQGQAETDAGGRAGDEDGVSADVHGVPFR
jgi:hypothetical protein